MALQMRIPEAAQERIAEVVAPVSASHW